MQWLHKMMNRAYAEEMLSLTLPFTLQYTLCSSPLSLCTGRLACVPSAWIWSSTSPSRRTERGRKEGRKENEGEVYILQLPTWRVAVGLSWSFDRWPQDLWSGHAHKAVRTGWGYHAWWGCCTLPRGFLHTSHSTVNLPFVKLSLVPSWQGPRDKGASEAQKQLQQQQEQLWLFGV